MTQTSPVCRYATSSRSYQLLSIHSLKLLMIHFMHRIPRVDHVIHSHDNSPFFNREPSVPNVAYTNLHCSSQSTSLHSNDTSHPSLSSSNRVSRPRAFTPQTHTERYRKHPIRDFDAPRYMFYVYGFDLSDRIWLVSIVSKIYPHTRRSIRVI